MTPEHVRPAAPIPSAWPSGEAYQSKNAGADAPLPSDVPWQVFITDGNLRQVIEMALANNRDLRLAILNVEQARAMYGIQQAELWPRVETTATMAEQRMYLNFTGQTITAKQANVNLGLAAWEIDVFGRIRSLKDRALQDYLASEQASRSAQILLVAEVANAYYALAADQERLKLAKETLATQEAALRIIQRQLEVGLATELDLKQAQSRVEAARVDIATFTQYTAQAENALNLLAGAPVPANLWPVDLASVSPPRDISAKLSSDVLLTRPDILQAEHQLRGADANIGAARAAFFPRISLTSAIGTTSGSLSDLFKDGSATWNYAPQIVMPIFDARTWMGYRVTKVQREIAVTQYEKAIQTAFREVADALAVRGTVDDQEAAQQALIQTAEETYRLADLRFSKGVDNYLPVLDAQRSLYGARQGLVSIRQADLMNQVRLYAVLGGGIPTPVAEQPERADSSEEPSAEMEAVKTPTPEPQTPAPAEIPGTELQ
jgi:multidrug efflux system outer membrane protein